MSIAYLGLGSNQGDRLYNIRQAVSELSAAGITIIGKSKIYETKPWGFVEQNDFINAVIQVETNLLPAALLSTCQQIEIEMGRVRQEKWGPRSIDIDILFYDDLIINQDNLTIPHPLAALRLFVLLPLADINSDLRFPDGKSVKDHIRALADDNHTIKVIEDAVI